MNGTILSSAAGVAASLFGGYEAAKSMRRVRKLLDEAERQNRSWYDRRMGQDYTQTAAAQDAMRRTREYAEELGRNAEGRRAVGGGTDESVAAAKEQANRLVADTAAAIAADGTKHKDTIERQYRNGQNSILKARMAIEEQKAKEIAKSARLF